MATLIISQWTWVIEARRCQEVLFLDAQLRRGVRGPSLDGAQDEGENRFWGVPPLCDCADGFCSAGLYHTNSRNWRRRVSWWPRRRQGSANMPSTMARASSQSSPMQARTKSCRARVPGQCEAMMSAMTGARSNTMCTARSLKLLQTPGNAQLSRCVPNALRLRIAAQLTVCRARGATPRRDMSHRRNVSVG